MNRFTAALALSLISTVAAVTACSAADLGPYRAPSGVRAGGSAAIVGEVRGRPQYSYYGEYGFPAPFGYGYAYAPTPGRNMEYGYYGPRYVVFAPETYRGPIFGYHEW